MAIGCLLYCSSTQAPSQRTSTGQAREQLAPRMFASRIVFADPSRLPLAIFLMNRGTSMCVGQAMVQGASKQYRQRFASVRAAVLLKGGCRSGKRAAISGESGACWKKFVDSLIEIPISPVSGTEIAVYNSSRRLREYVPRKNSSEVLIMQHF